MRALFTFAILFPLCVSCSPPPPARQQPQPERVWDVSVGDLMRTAPAYEGRLVRVRLNPGGYHVGPGAEVSYASPVMGSPPAVVWEFEPGSCPADNGKALSVTGRVLPVVPDGHPRSSGVSYQVRLSGCSASPAAP